MTGQRSEFPEISTTELREHVPALRHADRLLGEEADRVRGRVGARGLELIQRSRNELTELRTLASRGEKPNRGMD